MIPEDFINDWRQKAPWPRSAMVEQDLVISRALVDLYKPEIKSTLAFRGGTALNKLFFEPAARYSEDLDFVQIRNESIGETLSHIRSVLDLKFFLFRSYSPFFTYKIRLIVKSSDTS